MSELPVGWVMRPLEQLLQPIKGKQVLQQGWSPQCLAHPRRDESSWGVLKTTAVQSDGYRSSEHKELPDDLTPRPELEVQPGDLLLTCAGPRARCGVPAMVTASPERLMISGKMYRFRPSPHVLDAQFLFLYLSSPDAQRQIEAMKTGISDSGLNLTKAKFGALPVPVPSLRQQRRIVPLLEDHLSRLDAAQNYLDACDRRLDRMKEAVMRNSVTADWAEVPLRELLAEPLANGRSVPDGEGAPVLRLTALRATTVDPSAHKRGAWTDEQAAPFCIRRGDLLLSRGNGSLRLVGRAAIVGEDPPRVAFPDTMIRVRSNAEAVEPALLLAIWNSQYVRRQVEAAVRTTAGIYKINQKQLLDVRVPLPSRTQQSAVLGELRQAHDDAARLQTVSAALAKRRSALVRSLLATAFADRL